MGKVQMNLLREQSAAECSWRAFRHALPVGAVWKFFALFLAALGVRMLLY